VYNRAEHLRMRIDTDQEVILKHLCQSIAIESILEDYPNVTERNIIAVL